MTALVLVEFDSSPHLLRLVAMIGWDETIP
jgi:hypothetical protein